MTASPSSTTSYACGPPQVRSISARAFSIAPSRSPMRAISPPALPARTTRMPLQAVRPRTQAPPRTIETFFISSLPKMSPAQEADGTGRAAIQSEQRKVPQGRFFSAAERMLVRTDDLDLLDFANPSDLFRMHDLVSVGSALVGALEEHLLFGANQGREVRFRLRFDELEEARQPLGLLLFGHVVGQLERGRVRSR